MTMPTVASLRPPNVSSVALVSEPDETVPPLSIDSQVEAEVVDATGRTLRLWDRFLTA